MGRSRFVGVLAVMALGAGLVQGFGPAPSAASPIPARTSSDIAPSSAGADSSGSWTPENAPMPGVLPNGQPAVHMSLSGTSCSSASFCVAVGYVSDEEYHGFPLAETFTDGTWTPTVLPQPPDASTQVDEGPELLSVSCPQDGSCAAVGAYAGYDAATNSNYADPLLEVLSGGVWTATEGELPNGPNSGLVHLYSVSCDAAGSCTAVGNDADFSGSWFGLIYTLSFGTWQLQVAPVPADYSEGTILAGVSCPSSDSCVVVGSYQDAALIEHGLILTLSSGVWEVSVSPVPANAATEYMEGEPPPDAGLNAVDCPEDGSCLAVGFYVDANYDLMPMLVDLDAGVGTPAAGPLPPDAEANPQSQLMGVSCPADGSCVATGYYFIDALAGVASGVILVENDDGTWSAAPAPLPPTGTSGGPRRHRAAAAAATGGASGAAVSLGDVSCGSDGFCTALGTDDSANFLETGQVSVPSVSGVAPAEGPLAGGTTVTVSGANFTPTTTVSFGATAAASTTFVDADEIQAVSPSEGYGAVDVTVASGGLISRADDADGFTFEAPTAQPTTTAVTASDTPIVTGEPVTYTITVDPAPAGGTVSLTDGFGLIGSCDDLTLVSGIASCGVTYASTLARASTDDPFPVVARYSGDADDQPSGAVLSEVLEAGGPVITTTVLPGGTRGARYRARLTADGGRGPLHWKVIAGQLPTGTWLSRSGRVRGKPRTTGTFTFTVQVADSARPHRTATAGLTISISG